MNDVTDVSEQKRRRKLKREPFVQQTEEPPKLRPPGLAADLYNLISDFYEIGWGPSFHFAPMAKGEELEDAISRSEHHVALRLGLDRTMRVLDVGCGIGGPMRNIARLTEAQIIGLNNNRQQVRRAQALNRRQDFDLHCEVVEGDFFSMPFGENRFDAAYDFEATYHASPLRAECFQEIFRVLKPGARFATFQWCLTDRFDPDNSTHVAMKHAIEATNGLASLDTSTDVVQALRTVGFEMLENRDYALLGDAGRPWYSPLTAHISPAGLLKTNIGGKVAHQAMRALERLGLSPRGTTDAHLLVRNAQRSLIAAGKTGIFTPLYFCLARKPEVRSN